MDFNNHFPGVEYVLQDDRGQWWECVYVLRALPGVSYGAGTSSRTAPILEQIPKNSPKKPELAGNSHTSW